MARKILTIKELADKLTMRIFGSDQPFLHELQSILGRTGAKPNDSIPEILEDILKNA